ncbi:hypothetical protein ACFL01_01925 [Planctomycetota bacterium]
MFSIIRKFGKVFRGGVHPLEVGISVALAVMAGVVLGKNGLAGILLFLILVLNTNKVAFSLAGIPFGALGITLARYKFMVGRWALSHDPVARAFEGLANAPIGVFMGFDRYTVVGGFVAGVPLAILFGLFAMILTKKFRAAALALAGDKEAFGGWMSGKMARLGKWILFGVGEADYEKSLTRKPSPIRWSGVVLLAIFSLLVFIASLMDYGSFVKSAVEHHLTEAAGAQVDIGTFSLKPLNAAVRIVDLAVTDRAEPSKNSIEAKSLLADVSITGLLRRSLIAEELALSRLEMGTERAAPGKVVAPLEAASAEAEGTAASRLPKDAETIESYLTQWKAWKEHLSRLRDTLKKFEDSRKRSAEAETPSKAGEAPDYHAMGEKYGYDSIRAPEIRRIVPDLVVQKLTVEDIRTSNEYFNAIDLDVEHVVYPLRMASEPTLFRIIDKQGKGRLELSVDFSDPESPATFSMTMSGIPATDLNGQLSSKVPVTFEKGLVELKGTGTMRSDHIDVNLYVNVTDAGMKPKQNISIAGLRGKNLTEALDLIKDMDLWLALSGPPTRPRVDVKSGALAESLKSNLTEAFKKKLTEETEKVTKEIEKEKARLEKEKKILEQEAEYEKKKLKDAAAAEKRKAEKKAREEKKALEKKMKKAIEEEADKKAKELLKEVFK